MLGNGIMNLGDSLRTLVLALELRCGLGWGGAGTIGKRVDLQAEYLQLR
jgi:hypothetical protein